MKIFLVVLCCVFAQVSFASAGVPKSLDGRSSRVLIVDEHTPEDNSKDPVISTQTVTLQRVDEAGESGQQIEPLWKNDQGELLKLVKVDESQAKPHKEEKLTDSALQACPVDHDDGDNAAVDANELQKQIIKRTRSPSAAAMSGRSFLAKHASFRSYPSSMHQTPYPAYRTYLQPRGAESNGPYSPYGGRSSVSFRSEAPGEDAQRGRTFWPFTLFYDNYYDYPPPPPPPFYPVYPPPPPPGPYGPWF